MSENVFSLSARREILRKVRYGLLMILMEEYGTDKVGYDKSNQSIYIKDTTVKEVKETLLAPHWRKNIWQ
ncbi:MAG: hypothetical protein QXL94_01145 [Candidatus Parvarchaeum sp.]